MVKEVKKNAVGGDKIKIVDANSATIKSGILDGSVHTVIALDMLKFPCIYIHDGTICALWHDEYVVLEECEPTLSEAKESELEAELKKRREPKYFTGDVVCIESHSSVFREWRIYSIKNGNIYDDAGAVYTTNITSAESIPLMSKFKEILK